MSGRGRTTTVQDGIKTTPSQDGVGTTTVADSVGMGFIPDSVLAPCVVCVGWGNESDLLIVYSQGLSEGPCRCGVRDLSVHMM